MTIWLLIAVGIVAAGLVGLGLRSTLVARKKAPAAFPPAASLEPTPPAEPLRPKPVHPPAGAEWACSGLFSLGWTAFSLLFVILPVGMFVRDWQAYSLLKAEGTHTEGVVVSHRIDSDSDGNSYYITYRYTVPLPGGDRKEFVREETVSRAEYNDLPPESRVEVLYAPSNPEIANLRINFGPPFYLLFIAACGGVFVLVGLALLIHSWQTASHIRRLASQGRLTGGTITDCWQETDSDGDPVYCVAYRFSVLLPNGSSRVFTKAEYNRKAYQTLLPGSPVQIRYVPGRPELCRLELPR